MYRFPASFKYGDREFFFVKRNVGKRSVVTGIYDTDDGAIAYLTPTWIESKLKQERKGTSKARLLLFVAVLSAVLSRM